MEPFFCKISTHTQKKLQLRIPFNIHKRIIDKLFSSINSIILFYRWIINIIFIVQINFRLLSSEPIRSSHHHI